MSFRFARLSRTTVMATAATAALAAGAWQAVVQAQPAAEQAERQEAERREQAAREAQELAEDAIRQRQKALERASRTEAELREQQQVRLEQLRQFRENQEREARERERHGAGERGERPLRLSEDQLAELQERARHVAHRHPNVTSTRARLVQAEAELRQSMLEASKEAMEIQFNWLRTEREVDALRALKGKIADERDLEQRLAAARRRLMELDLRREFLLGDDDEGHEEEAAHEDHGRDFPAGPMAKKLAEALNQPLHLEFVDTPVRDVTSFLADTLDLPFHLDRHGLEEEGLEATMPLNIDVSDVPVAAGLQALTDLHPGLTFVVTDYGIVLTAREGRLAERYVSAHAFWRETLEDREEEESEDEMESGTRTPDSPPRPGEPG